MTSEKIPDPRLAVFLELNSEKKKAPWQRRIKLVEDAFPSFRKLDWRKAFDSDERLWGAVLREILKDEQREPGRSGPRPNLVRDPALAKLREYQGDDYNEHAFPAAMRELAGMNSSVRSIARKTGLPPTFVHRLMAGERVIDVVTLEQIAKSYKKDPGYFLEYRVSFVLAALGDKLATLPEATVGLYRRLRGERPA